MRITLEDSDASSPLTGAGHLYLVAREDIEVNGEGDVLRAGNPFGPLTIFSGDLADLTNPDRYGTGDTELTRHARSVTGFDGTTEAAWSKMVTYAEGIDQQYDYELPPQPIEGRLDIANSNAVVFSALNSVDVDARELPDVEPPDASQYPAGFPGAALSATYIGMPTLLGIEILADREPPHAGDDFPWRSVAIRSEDTGDTLFLPEQFCYTWSDVDFVDHNITSLHFANGTTWDGDQIAAEIDGYIDIFPSEYYGPRGQMFEGTGGNDTENGGPGDDTFDLGAGRPSRTSCAATRGLIGSRAATERIGWRAGWVPMCSPSLRRTMPRRRCRSWRSCSISAMRRTTGSTSRPWMPTA